MRSKLFVPCSRPDFFAKALASEADAVSFDLEDSVALADKESARARLIEVLKSDAVLASTKRVIVRVNGPDTAFFADDIAALGGLRIDLVNVPKVEDADTVRSVAAKVAEAGIAALLINVESALGLARAGEIARAHPSVAGLQVGLNDLFASLEIDRRDPRHVHAALWSIRLAAGEAGCLAYDGAWPDLADDAGFRAEAELARSLGYLGKSCVHPRQVAIANAVFDRDADLDRARRLLAAATAAAARGQGAFVFEGKMTDAPAIAAARAAVARGAA